MDGKKPKFVVVSSPCGGFTPTPLTNLAYARACWDDSASLGETPFSIAALHPVKQVSLSRMDLAIELDYIGRAELVAVYCDRGISEEMEAVIDAAGDAGVSYRSLYEAELAAVTTPGLDRVGPSNGDRTFWKWGPVGIYGGVCNRTACRRVPATWWNRGSRMYYCQSCARKINQYCTPGEPPMLVEVPRCAGRSAIEEGS